MSQLQNSLYSDLWWWGWVTAKLHFCQTADFYLRSANGPHSWRGMSRFTPYSLLPVGFLSEGRDQEGVLAEVISELDKDGKEFIGWLWPSSQPCFFTLASVKPPHSSSWSQFAIFLTQNWLLYIQSEMSAPTQQWSLFSGLSFSSWHPSTEPLNFNNSDLFPLWSPIPRVIAAYCSCYLCYTL